MLTRLRRGKRAQSIVIVALSATALFGIIALGLDAGRLYFQRRDVQNAADAGALAGAQELLPNGAFIGVSSQMQTAANCQAANYALLGLQAAPRDGGCSPSPSSAYDGSSITEPAANNFPATVQVWTPSRNNPNEIHVRVTYNVPLTFAAVLGFTSSAVVSDAYAHGGFRNKTYTIFGFDAGGNGNSVNYDQIGNIQIDDGKNGQDICRPDPDQGRLVSNAKWHAPIPGGGWNNLNGQFFYSQAADTHALVTYWYGNVGTSQPTEQTPNYEPPLKPADAMGPSGTNPVVYHPGTYHNNINLTASNVRYEFENGIYYFDNVNFTITGGTVSNTSDGQPHYVGFGGVTDLQANPQDHTNGVEFVFDGNSKFSVSTSGNTSPSVFFVGPSFVSSGTDSLVFFIKSTDTISGPNGTPWSETIDGTKPTAGGYPFQIWGSIFDADTNGSHGTVVTLQAAASANGTPVRPNAYAVNGEVIGPQVDLDGGNLANGPYSPSNPGPGNPPNPCNPNGLPNNGYVSNPAGLVDQFNPHYVPHWRGLAYLVK
ncbi:MAG TPA: pilus assembly protein TadG-related protein [Candidatus Dormibacteraeota bacterium]|nr:pilus assembly protein TadG-related protein [Candidatus Dormibacteraeota bacterium]